MHADGSRTDIAPAADTRELAPVDAPPLPEPLPAGPTRRAPLGQIAGARSGDKGGSANVGVWVRTDEQWRWLAHTLTVEKLRELLPETADLPVTRHLLPNLRAVNFVIDGILGEGVAYQARFDPQAKGLGEWLRSRHVDIPGKRPMNIWHTPNASSSERRCARSPNARSCRTRRSGSAPASCPANCTARPATPGCSARACPRRSAAGR